MRRPRHAEGIADDEGAPWHGGLEHRRHGAHALADDAALLGLEPDQEAGTVAEVDHRHVKGLGHVEEARHLLAGVGRPSAAVEHRVARHHRDGPAVDASEAGDDRPAVESAHLEEAALVDDLLDDRADAIDLADVAWDDVEQRFFAPRRIVGLRTARRRVIDGRGQVGEKAARGGKGLLFAVDRLVDGPGAKLDFPAAQFLLVVLFGAEAIHHRRAGDEHRRDLLHHHRIMRGGEPRRAKPRDGAEAEAHRGHGAHVLDGPFPAVHARNIGAAGRLDRLHRAAAARALDHTDNRHAVLVGVAFDEVRLFLDRGVGRAAAHGEVVAGDGHRPAVDLAAAHDGIGRHQVDEVVAAVVLGLAGDAAELAEGVLVEQPVDALAHGQSTAIVLALDLVGPAHAPRHLLAAAQLVHFRLPAHVRVSPVRLPCFARMSVKSRTNGGCDRLQRMGQMRGAGPMDETGSAGPMPRPAGAQRRRRRSGSPRRAARGRCRRAAGRP